MDEWSTENMQFYYLSMGGDYDDEAVIWGDRLGLLDAVFELDSKKNNNDVARTKPHIEVDDSHKTATSNTELIPSSRIYSENKTTKHEQINEDLKKIREAFKNIKFSS